MNESLRKKVRSYQLVLIWVENSNKLLLINYKVLMDYILREFKLVVHGSNESLHKYIHPSILPKSLGGIWSESDYADMEIIKSLRGKDDYYEGTILSYNSILITRLIA
jgi:hypothetical protein